MTTLEIDIRSQAAATIADRDVLLSFLADRAGGGPVACPLCDEVVGGDPDAHLEAHRPG